MKRFWVAMLYHYSNHVFNSRTPLVNSVGAASSNTYLETLNYINPGECTTQIAGVKSMIGKEYSVLGATIRRLVPASFLSLFFRFTDCSNYALSWFNFYIGGFLVNYVLVAHDDGCYSGFDAKAGADFLCDG